MKINSITTNTGYLTGSAHGSSLGRDRECAKERINLKQNNYEQINTTIGKNSDGRVSFKGDPSTMLHKIARFSGDNPLLAEALFALLITCGARPITIMATAKTEEDKEKCRYQVAKSISSGLIGLAATALINNPIKNASGALASAEKLKLPETVKAKAEEIGGKVGEKIIANYSSTAKNIMDKIFQPIFLPLRAKVTIMAVPAILGAFGLRKTAKKKAESATEQQNNASDYVMFKGDNEKEIFKAFSGVIDNENK